MAIAERESQLAQSVRDFISQPKQLFIGGQWVDGATGERFATIDPATGREITQVALAGPQDVDRAVAAAREAFDDGRWSALEPRKRAKVLFKVADMVEKRAQEIAQLDVLDNGKPINFAVGEVIHSAFVYRYFAGFADKIYGETNPTAGDQFTYTLREPMGVCAQVIPWNFPSAMAAYKLAPALAFGNCSVLKPAEETPLSALFLAEIFREAGLPDGVLNILTGDGESTGAPLVAHKGIDKIAFTGSTEVGRKILAASGNNLARVTLELGGKSPNIIFPDADLSKAIPQSAYGFLFNSGQMCTAGTRLLVSREIHDETVDALTQTAKTWKVGDGLDPTTLVGPLASQQQFDRVSEYLRIGASEGAQVQMGGSPVDGEGFFVEPTIFTGVKPDMRIAQEEIFGPVVSVISFDDVDEAIRIANDTMYGLASAVWTNNLSVAHKVARGIRAGTVWVNSYGIAEPSASFGGYKASGFGRELGKHAVDAYTQIKTVWMSL